MIVEIIVRGAFYYVIVTLRTHRYSSPTLIMKNGAHLKTRNCCLSAVEIALPLLIAMATATKREEEPSLFELAQKLLAQGRELLEQDLNNARQEKETIEEITKTLNEVHFASTIKLNVGGKIYKTTLDTLKKDPDSMLCAMFSGRFELKVDEDDGAYFIDRDGELFR